MGAASVPEAPKRPGGLLGSPARLVSLVLLAGCALVAALFLFPADSDGALANHDGIWYAMLAEHLGRRSIMAHHVLFHMAVVGLVDPLKALGIASPGSVACRIVAGAGAALVLLLVASRARARWVVGCGFALVLLSSRSFLVEAAVGENVLPACAAALATLIVATRPTPSPWKVGAAFAVALLFRQDNLLLLPAVFYALWSGLPRERRFRTITLTLVAGGAVAALGSVAAWRVARQPGQSLWTYLVDLGRHDWSLSIVGPRALAHTDAFGIAAVGRHWWPDDHHLWIPAALLAALGVAAWGLRGDAAPPRFWRACLLAIATRIPFFLWFEAHNPEWHVLTWVLVAACGSSAAAGSPRTSVPLRVMGTAILLALSVVILRSHGPHTWLLRDRTMTEAIHALGDLKGVEVFTDGHIVGTAFSRLRIPRTVLGNRRDANMAFLRGEVETRPRPMLFMIDRMVLDGMPYSLDHLNEYDHHLDSGLDTEDLRLERWRGRVYAFRFMPEVTTRQAK